MFRCRSGSGLLLHVEFSSSTPTSPTGAIMMPARSSHSNQASARDAGGNSSSGICFTAMTRRGPL